MSLRSQLATLAFAALAALVTFHLLQRQLVGVLPGSATAEMLATIERGQADLKALAQADPVRAREYRARFTGLQELANRLRVLEHNREELAARQQALVLGAGAAALMVFGAALLAGARRDSRRLSRIGSALGELAAGRRDLRLADRSGDHIGTIARMIERASDAVARDRQRLESLRHLEAWQEAARRQSHELRTPLTVARLELERAQEAIRTNGAASDVSRALAEVHAEIQRLHELVLRFATFAKLPAPDLCAHDLRQLVAEFAATFAEAWPGLQLRCSLPDAECGVRADRAMLRQVLVNLCDNSARAVSGGRGTVTLALMAASSTPWQVLEVRDDGPGIPETLRARVFEPYVTTAPAGEGMGLGLAISRKILLDHGGDLELAPSSAGAAFRLLLPRGAPCAA
jgi:signal transduction histidine kinase